MASGKISGLTAQVLRELKSLPGERIDKVFLVSLCEKPNSSKMWREFGGYCLKFPASSRSGINISAPRGYTRGYGFITEVLPAIYDRQEQEAALAHLLDLLVKVLEDPKIITGHAWAADLPRFIAVTVCDFALRFIVPLKTAGFRSEHEGESWSGRIVPVLF